MDDPLSILGALAILVALFGSFSFSLAEAALVAVNALTVRRRAESGDRRAAIIQQMRATGDYLTALIIGFNACNLAVATIMTVLLRRTALSPAHQQLAHLATIAFILIVAEITPKTYGSLFAEPVALRVAPTIQALIRLLRPLITLLSGASRLLLKTENLGLTDRSELITAAQIQAAADISEESGEVLPEEGKMFDSVMELAETTVKEIMVARVDITALPSTANLDQIMNTAIGSGFSRIPVYEDDIDRITGVLYVNDLLAACAQGPKDLQAGPLSREPLFVPETKRVAEMFRQMRAEATHLAIVVDEFGGTEGLVTIEDILEELVGEIEDEYDVPRQTMVVLSETETLVDGKTPLEEVNVRLGLELPEDDYETVAGLVSGVADRIPAPGDVVTYNGIRFIIQAGDRQQINQIRIVTEAERGD